ncbi:hypothetical protein BST81_25095 [Leptolyngbya sp. 'hensonii']|nr:hypothetical protein BST81_25095 [Leptolyngbya sp. 'hensonii']
MIKNAQKSLEQHPILFLLITGLSTRLYNLQSPILGIHSWRQADTAAMARNFYENGYNFLYPQVDWGGNSSGYCETEFPIYSYIIALIYKFTGVFEAYGRLLSIIFALIGIYFLYRLIEDYLGKKTAFWSCLIYSILPLNIYYSRTFQAESMTLMAGIISIYGFSCWLNSGKKWQLLSSACFLALACLLKVLPIVYFGLPIAYLAYLNYGKKMVFKISIWLYVGFVSIVTILWYYHAHQIYLESNLTFGFWSNQSDRFKFSLLVSVQFWLDILFRLIFRHFAVFGFPIFLIGLTMQRKAAQEYMFDVGLLGVLITTIAVPTSSYIHEYYQLPFMVFAVPFIGKVLANMSHLASPTLKYSLTTCLILIFALGSGIYALDYMRPEQPKKSDVYALAQQIQALTPPSSIVVAMTGGDPTLLYLSHRKGWLVVPEQITDDYLTQRTAEGAGYLVGNYTVIQSYAPFTDIAQKQRIRTIIQTRSRVLVNTDRFFIGAIP